MFNESFRSNQKPPTIVEEDEVQKKNRPPDLSGFSILDERWRDSSSDDSDDSLPVGNYSNSAPAGRFCKSFDLRTLNREKKEHSTIPSTLPSTPTLKNPPTTPISNAMASGGSRFKIVPVETRYKRNRWNCYDYYEHRDPFFTRVPKPPCPTPTAALKKEEIINRSSRSLSDIHPVPAASSTPKTTHNISHLPPALPKPVYISPKPTVQAAAVKSTQVHSHTITNGSTAQANLKNSANNQCLKGLETSLAEPRRTKSVAASPPVHPTLNIDSKIEQAMDLVKTHLMFAVREEVDGLRSKIFELENHVHRLESENTILRKTIPNDILQKLQHKS